MSLFDKIPNNVNLSDDKRLQRALETWQPDFLQWWRDMGPDGFQEDQVFLRTAISVNSDGWANYDYVKMPDYRWGIFLAPPVQDRRIGFGENAGQPVWSEVPGELRNILRRIIVTQADTEPASVEQQRKLGATAPSLYDLRNLFQVNVEEGRHLWAMVHLLHQFFGRDGREEAEQLLMRRAGNPDTPRILSTFNEPTDDWLSFFCFTMFTDRDGKYQLASLAESGFDPLSRATRFMLTEEAFHLFVGETGLDRVVRRTAELTKQDPNGDARALGGVDLGTLQKYINFWFSSAVELFGGEISSNAADFFGTGLKGRYKEDKYQDHAALEGLYSIDAVEDGRVTRKEVPLRNALNEVLRDEYVNDCERACKKWNRTLAEAGLSQTLKLPSRKFNRSMGIYAGLHFDLDGKQISRDEFEANRATWLPTAEDRAYVRSLMVPVLEPGKMANWIAPPAKGVEGRPIDYEYVRGEGVERIRRGEHLPMQTLKSYVLGGWVAGQGKLATLINPTTEEPLALAGTEGIDMGAVLEHARKAGEKLRALSFAQRGEILKGLSKAVHAAREELIELGLKNAGNTRSDAKFDIDGASGTLMAYAELGAQLGDATFFVDGEAIAMGRSSRMAGQHVYVPRQGVAVHINAFNFPAWGLAEKAACALLAGVPVIAKPATATAWMSVVMTEKLIATGLLPEGALQLLVGSTGDLLKRLGPQDLFAFTGSSTTATELRGYENVLAKSVRVNVEADSLNAAVLGPDVERGSEAYDLFLADVVRDITQKAGQKCTAIRRVFVPAALVDGVREDLVDRLSAIKVGDPSRDDVKMGPVATASQLRDVREGIKRLLSSERVTLAIGGAERPAELLGVEGDKGFFIAPTLLVAEDARASAVVHHHEVFGPSATLLPYDGTAAEAVALVALGEGGLVASLYTDDRAFARDTALGLAAHNGRVYIGSAKVAGVSLGPGTVFPQLVHGGPGHAGGGEELGGTRGLLFYMQRAALQGYGPLLDGIITSGKRLLAIAVHVTLICYPSHETCLARCEAGLRLFIASNTLINTVFSAS